MRIFFIFLALLSTLQAHRIITLTPSLSEIVYGLGLEKDLVGVSTYAAFPPSVTKLPQVGGYFSPSIEKILSLRPTLVLGQEHHRAFLEKLKALGLDVRIVKLDSLHAIQQSIQSIATALKVSVKDTLTNIQKALKTASDKKARSKKVLITYGVIKHPKQDTMFIAGNSTFYTDIIKACGAKNAFSANFTGEPRLRFENLIALNPDMVIMLSSVLTDGHPDKKAIQKTWASLPINASKNGKVLILDQDYLLIPSHRVASTIKTLCQSIQK